MNKKWKSLARTLFLVIVGLIVGVNVYVWNARSLMGNALPMPFGYGAAVVLTGSMEPAIPADAVVFVQARDRYEPGEVVVYQSDSLLVVHRIVSIDGEMVTTRGDANNTEDTPLPLSRIRGRVIGHLPWAGALIRLLKTPAAPLILIAAALWTTEASFRKERKKDDDELEKIKEEIRRLKAEQE